MTDPPVSKARRFGWFMPDPEKGDGQINVLVHSRELSDAEWEEFEEIVGVVAEMRPYIIDFLALGKDFDEVEALGRTLSSAWETVPLPPPQAAIRNVANTTPLNR